MTMAASLNADDFLSYGLQIAGIFGWRRCKESYNLDRFKARFGVVPKTCEMVWTELCNFDDATIRLTRKHSPKHFLLGLRFLWTYGTEPDLGDYFGIQSAKTVGKHSKIWVRKIAALLKKKVRCSCF